MVTEEEKGAILDYLGGAETLDEESLSRASELSVNKSEDLAALLEQLQRHDYKPEEEIPAQPVTEPQSPAGAELVQGIVSKMMGEQ